MRSGRIAALALVAGAVFFGASLALACGGSPTAINGGISEAVTIGTGSSTAVCPANSNRSFLLIQNIGSNTIYCAVGTNNAATASNGFQLTAGEYFQAVASLYNGTGAPASRMLLGDVACIASGGSSSVAALEN